ncbi:MAG: PQQ-binding-like beta-propeller repeat protein [Pirellulaceae bacterium]|nr:PQQ-binding-like beta-propeller repeat protein [Pirellulaceae bacterium]
MCNSTAIRNIQFLLLTTVLTTLTFVRTTCAFDELPTAAEAEQLGLVIQWQSQTERTQTGSGETGMVLWPHTTMRKEIVTVRIGDRVVEEIDANASERFVSSLKPNSIGDSKSSRIGIEAARKQADAIVARYARIGRTATIETIDQPVTFLVTASNDGAVQALNAETGVMFWSNAIGDFRLPSWGPGVNDRFVTITNGMYLYVLDLLNGRVVESTRLTESATTISQPIGSKIYVPGIAGSLIAYDGDNLKADTLSVRFTGTLAAPVIASNDGKYLAWPNGHHLYIAQTGVQFVLWSRLESTTTFRSMPQLTTNGFITVATDGIVYRVGLERKDSIVWRENLAVQLSRPPLVANGIVMVVSDTGDGYALDEAKGDVLWKSDLPDLERILAITAKKVYAQRKAGQLVAIDIKTGKTLANLRRPFAEGYFNRINDRVLLRTANGTVLCLREPDAVYPKLNIAPYSEANATEVAKKATDGSTGPSLDMESPAVGLDSVFGTPATPSNDAGVMSDDPFNIPAGALKTADPFSPF